MEQSGVKTALRGNYAARIDDKGRLKIPTAFRGLVEGQHGAELFVTSLKGASVLIYPMPVWMALEVQSVQALWFFTSDLVFVLLFPQLVYALYDPKANLTGSVAAFTVSLLLRIGGGEPLFGMPALIPYPEWWPFKTIAAAAGMLLLPVVSRLTGSRIRTNPPRIA